MPQLRGSSERRGRVLYPELAEALDEWWDSGQHTYGSRKDLAGVLRLPVNTLNRYFSGIRFPSPEHSKRLYEVTRMPFLGPGRLSARLLRRHLRKLRTPWAQDLLKKAHDYVDSIPSIGEVRRRKFYGYAAQILGCALGQGIGEVGELTPGALLALALNYEQGRRFDALTFFAGFLVAQRKWSKQQEQQLNTLLGRFPTRAKILNRPHSFPSASKIRGKCFRRGREILGIPSSRAALLMGIRQPELRQIERRDLPIPDAGRRAVETMLGQVRQVQENMQRGQRQTSLRRRPPADLPFPHPACPRCRIPLNVKAKNYSKVRGRHWYFDCSQCGRHFWSNDGKLHPVSPAGTKKKLSGRVKCPDCRVDCRVVASPGKRSRRHYWQCSKCGVRYKDVNGKAVPTQPVRSQFKDVPFLQSRSCPRCRNDNLCVKSRPPTTQHWYFRCSNCDASFRWNKKLRKLVRLKRRKAYARKKFGRPTGMSPETKGRIRLAAAHQVIGTSKWKMKKFLYPNRRPEEAYTNTKRFFRDFKEQIESDKKRLTPNQARTIVANGAAQAQPS